MYLFTSHFNRCFSSKRCLTRDKLCVALTIKTDSGVGFNTGDGVRTTGYGLVVCSTKFAR